MNINERRLIDTAIGFASLKKVVIPEPLEVPRKYICYSTVRALLTHSAKASMKYEGNFSRKIKVIQSCI